MSKVEFLQEGWVKFRRHNCTEGFIDVWQGDMADNPNNEEKCWINLNSISVCIRCNNSEWISVRELPTRHYLPYLDMAEEFTAEEIWKEINRKKNTYENNN